MGLILNQYEKLIDINLKLKLIKNFVLVNSGAIQEHPEILNKFNIEFNNVVIRFTTDETNLINVVICDTDGFVLHYINKVRSIEHFYYENTVILKILGIYEGWDSTYMVDTKTGTLKRLVNPFRVINNQTHDNDDIGMLKNTKVRVRIKNGKATPIAGSLSTVQHSRFDKLFG